MAKVSAAVKKKVIYSTLPAQLRKPLGKPRLRKLTFGDIDTVEKQLLKYWNNDQAGYKLSSCGACCGWP